MFSSRLSVNHLVEMFRALRHQLAAGLTVRDSFRQQARSGNPAVRPLCKRVVEAVERGESLGEVLEREKAAFPAIVMPLVHVGEETGKLPEAMQELERYMTLERDRRREFRRQAMGPLLQLAGAVFIIAIVIYVVGIIAESRNSQPIRIFGLAGPTGSLIFVSVVLGVVAAIVLVWKAFPKLFGGTAGLTRLLMRIPLVGTALETLALGRFALGLHLTLDAGIPIVRAMNLSFDLTDNPVYRTKAPQAAQALQTGHTLYDSLAETGIFPASFLEMIASSEEAGRVPEMMRHQAEYLHDEATRRIGVLVKAAGGFIWLCVAGFIIYTIFAIYGNYINALGGGIKGI
ncbi:MAG: type II secretion system F family protein [Gemmataceae bacterium]|nr:type II secretion system F family protein [Gemmataceae bacterium]